MDKEILIVMIIIGLIVVGSAFFVVLVINEESKPCLEYKTYCYYSETTTAVGVGPAIGGKGGVAMTITPVTNKIYVDCDDENNSPYEIQVENKCIRRSNE